MAREEATRVKAALDKEQKKKEAYLAEMKEQGYNLGSVGGSLTKEEEDMLRKVEGGAQLMLTEKGKRAFSFVLIYFKPLCLPLSVVPTGSARHQNTDSPLPPSLPPSFPPSPSRLGEASAACPVLT